MENEFLKALGTETPNVNTDLSLYENFVGTWSFQLTAYDENGTVEDRKEGEWLFSYIINAFTWESVYSKDNGVTWKVVTRVEAVRV